MRRLMPREPSCRHIEVKVKPRSAAASLTPSQSGPWRAELRAAPSDGKANAELIDLIARHFGCQRSQVSIKRGASSRLKLVKIDIDRP